MSRSYFFSFLSEFDLFINSIPNYTLGEIDILCLNAKTLSHYFSSEELALETFPALSYIVDILTILSYLNSSDLISFNSLIEFYERKQNEIELLDTIKYVISFILIPSNTIKEDIFEKIKTNLKNNLRIIQDDELDDESIIFRKKIRKILKENVENDRLECKGTLSIPIPSKSDLLKIDELEKKLVNIKDIGVIEIINTQIHSLKNPEISKSKKEEIIKSWIKTIAAFANTNGGELIIGIGENKYGDFELLGLGNDLKVYKNLDNLLLDFDEKFAYYIGDEYKGLVSTKIIKIDGNNLILYVDVKKSTKPVFVNATNGHEDFYIRRNASTKKLSIREFYEYKQIMFNQQ